MPRYVISSRGKERVSMLHTYTCKDTKTGIMFGLSGMKIWGMSDISDYNLSRDDSGAFYIVPISA